MSHPVTIVIPAYNEAAALPAVLRGIARQSNHDIGEVIVIDDGSSDGTTQAALAVDMPTLSMLRVLRNRTNKGCGASIKRGIKEAVYDRILIMDADGQHRPDDIPHLLAVAEQFDLVVGYRQPEGGYVGNRRFGRWLLTRLAEWIAGGKITDLTSGFRLFRRTHITPYLHLLSDTQSFMATQTLLYLMLKRDVGYVPIRVRPRSSGKSNVRGVRDGLLALRMLTRFNPLRIFVPAATVATGAGALYGAWGIWQIMHIPAGAALAVTCGIILLAIGLIADHQAAMSRKP